MELKTQIVETRLIYSGIIQQQEQALQVLKAQVAEISNNSLVNQEWAKPGMTGSVLSTAGDDFDTTGNQARITQLLNKVDEL